VPAQPGSLSAVAELELLPFDDYVRSLNKKRMSAGVLFHDADGRVLLVQLSYVAHWDIPGGTVDAEEAPWTTAAREVREELGLDLPLGRLLVIDYIPTNDQLPQAGRERDAVAQDSEPDHPPKSPRSTKAVCAGRLQAV